jgi:hypothetical protein
LGPCAKGIFWLAASASWGAICWTSIGGGAGGGPAGALPDAGVDHANTAIAIPDMTDAAPARINSFGCSRQMRVAIWATVFVTGQGAIVD